MPRNINVTDLLFDASSLVGEAPDLLTPQTPAAAALQASLTLLDDAIEQLLPWPHQLHLGDLGGFDEAG